MKPIKKQLVDTSFLIIILILLAILIIPWMEREISFEIDKDSSFIEEEEKDILNEEAVHINPAEIAVLFGYEETITKPAPRVEERVIKEEPVIIEEATWLKFVSGYINESYGFIDKRINRAISLSLGETKSGYKLVRIDEEKFFIEYKGTTYFVRKKEQ